MSPRGGVWVVAQFVLMGFVVAAAFVGPGWPAGGIRFGLLVVGAGLACAGAAQAAAAFRAFGETPTPFPEPRDGARLIETGPFARVRHPIYGGVLGVFAGVGFATRPAALGIALVLGLLWEGKARTEERRLAARFPNYAAYAMRVRRRFVPGVW